MSKPDTFIQRTYADVAIFVDGNRVFGSLTRETMHGLLDATVPHGDGDIEYLVCSHVDEHGHNVVYRSSCEFGEALECLLESGIGQYMVAIRP
jgi:hypothetical protein